MSRLLSRRQLLLSCVTQDSVELEDVTEDEEEDEEEEEENNLVFSPTSPVCRIIEVILL